MMKNIFRIIALLFIMGCKAQTPIISTVEFDQSDDINLTEGSYLKDVENKFAPFLGTWLWQNGNSSLEIHINKMEMVFDGEIYEDLIIGKYRYINNGTEVLNTLDVTPTTLNVFNWANDLIIGNGYYTDTSQIFRITDRLKGIYCYLEIKLTTPTQAQWKIWRIDGGKQPSGFTFPTEVTLIKQ